ncbi:MAG: flagella basal body P-ring formation protein FlgA [Acidobacteriaceae bacterium]
MQLVGHMTRWFLGAWLVAAAPAFANCGASHSVLADWGLHRQWRVECDAAHPERPDRMVEIAWSDPEHPAQPQATTFPGAAPRPPILVQAAARVQVLGRAQDSVIHLSGTALEAGVMGAAIRVRAGWNGAVLRGIVRGTGVVELLPERGRH